MSHCEHLRTKNWPRRPQITVFKKQHDWNPMIFWKSQNLRFEQKTNLNALQLRSSMFHDFSASKDMTVRTSNSALARETKDFNDILTLKEAQGAMRIDEDWWSRTIIGITPPVLQLENAWNPFKFVKTEVMWCNLPLVMPWTQYSAKLSTIKPCCQDGLNPAKMEGSASKPLDFECADWKLSPWNQSIPMIYLWIPMASKWKDSLPTIFPGKLGIKFRNVRLQFKSTVIRT